MVYLFKNGRYNEYENDSIKTSHFMKNDCYYGKCIYYYCTGQKFLESELYGTGYERCICYDRNGDILYRVNYVNKKKYVEYYKEEFPIYKSFIDEKINSCMKGNNRNECIRESCVVEFHYNNGKISFRDKNDIIVKYYMNRYIKGCYKSKKLLFY